MTSWTDSTFWFEVSLFSSKIILYEPKSGIDNKQWSGMHHIPNYLGWWSSTIISDNLSSFSSTSVLLSRMTMMSSPSNFFLISQNIKPQIKVTAKTINPYRYFLFSFYRFHNHYLWTNHIYTHTHSLSLALPLSLHTQT